jgi:hypothetical protein
VRDFAIAAVVQTAIDVLSQADPTPAPVPPPSSAEPKSVSDAVLQMLVAAGPVGVFFLMVNFKFKLMTVSEHEALMKEKDEQITKLEADKDELKGSLREANGVYTTQVIPTLTRVLDAERELVDLRRQEQQNRWRREDGDGGEQRGRRE